MKQLSRNLFYFFLFLPALFLNGCQGSPVPHLTAEVIQLEEGMSGKEVKAYLGDPDFRQDNPDGEKWIYRRVDKSLLRKTPLIGGFMGTATVKVVTVDFQQNKVTGFRYQTMTPEEFKEKGYRGND